MDSQPAEWDEFLQDVWSGLSRDCKQLPCKYFYDERGSQLFEQICELEEYYITRVELEIMRRYAGQMAEAIGPNCRLVEYGSGSSRKTEILLEHLQELSCYVPVDISGDHLQQIAGGLAERFPELPIRPVAADFTQPFELPECAPEPARTVVYFPGSTIGNFGPQAARKLLVQIAAECGPGGGLLIGVDLKKPRHVLEAAYDDGAGVTRAFNKNLLARINRELSADFDLDQFEHRAVYNDEAGRIEIYLDSLSDQQVQIAGRQFNFAAGEAIHTENSYKYTLAEFRAIAEPAAFSFKTVWTDPREYFSVQMFAA